MFSADDHEQGLADPDCFACRCASACSFIWASGARRDGNVVGVHMFAFVDARAEHWSPRERDRQTARGVRELDAFLAQLGMPEPIRAHMWRTPPEIPVRAHAIGNRSDDTEPGLHAHTGGKLQINQRSNRPR
jgi:hypothetical protein